MHNKLKQHVHNQQFDMHKPCKCYWCQFQMVGFEKSDTNNSIGVGIIT